MTTVPSLVSAAVIGIGATAGIDVWNLALKRLFDIRSLDYCLLGRWVCHLPRGIVRHRSIAVAPRVQGECPVGWTAHYAIGVMLALTFVLMEPDWMERPTWRPALFYGIATVALPFFILQPALGLGVASSATPNPSVARLKSLTTHGVYGLGLHFSAYVLRLVLS